MNRTDRKCILASACGHGLLLVVVVFGVGFFPRTKDAPVTFITMIPADAIITDGTTRGGGNPNVTTMPAAGSPQAAPITRAEPPPPRPAPPKPAQREPDPTPEPPRPVAKTDTFKLPEDAKKLKKSPTKSTPESKTKSKSLDKDALKLTPGKTPGKTKTPAQSNANAAADTKAARDAQRQLLNSALAGIAGGTSKGVGVEIPGPGGQAYVNYGDLIRAVLQRRFDHELEISAITPSRGQTVGVSLTIARDGRVITRSVTRRAGSRALDGVVQRVIDGVTEFAPFPATTTDSQRVFEFTFRPEDHRIAG